MLSKVLLSSTLAGLVALPAVIALAQPPVEGGGDPARAFAAGKQRFSAGDYLSAIESFEEAYRLRPHHSVLCNIALCYERQGNFVTAAAKYRACLDEGGGETAGADAIRNSLRRAEARVGWVAILSPGAGGTVYVDGRARGEAPQRLELNPGNHVIEVRRPGAASATKTVTMRGGEELTLELQPRVSGAAHLEKQASPTRGASRRRLSKAWFWTMVGVTGVLATTAAVLGISTLAIRSDYEDRPTQELRDKGLARRTATNVLWGVTAVGAAATTTLYFFTDFGGENSGKRAGAGRRAVALGVGVRGRF